MMKIRTWRFPWAVLLLSASLVTGCSHTSAPATASPTTAKDTQAIDAELTNRIAALAKSIDDDVAVSVVHVEAGRTVNFEAAKKLELYSVFKLPLAIAV